LQAFPYIKDGKNIEKITQVINADRQKRAGSQFSYLFVICILRFVCKELKNIRLHYRKNDTSIFSRTTAGRKNEKRLKNFFVFSDASQASLDACRAFETGAA
jgi:hypothetical protein